MLKIGHRGAKVYVAENTLESFLKAISMGVDMIELDVQLSNDGIPVVIHDETVDRTTKASGLVEHFSATDLQSFGIPTLEQVFDIINQKCSINIEIKNTKATQAVLELTTSYINTKNWQPSDFLLSSFHWNELEEIANTQSLIPIGIISENPLNVTLAFAKKIKAHSIHPFFELIDKEDVSLMQAEGFKVYPWTVNAPKAIMLMHAYGVDGIISDFPDRI